jgi:hypothetical protein
MAAISVPGRPLSLILTNRHDLALPDTCWRRSNSAWSAGAGSGNRYIGQGLRHRIDHAAIPAILPLRQTRDDAGSNRLQPTQRTGGHLKADPKAGV